MRSSLLRASSRLSRRRPLLAGNHPRATPLRTEAGRPSYLSLCRPTGHRGDLPAGSFVVPFPNVYPDSVSRPRALLRSDGKQKGETNREQTRSSDYGSGRGEGSGGNRHKNNRNAAYLSLLLAIAVAYITSHADESSTVERDITWDELQKKIREDLVDKVVLNADKTTARVYLKQSVVADANTSTGDDAGGKQSEPGVWNGSETGEQSVLEFIDDTSVQFGEEASDESTERDSSTMETMARRSRHVHHGNRPKVYDTKRPVVLTISIDHSFEAKLEQIQHGMNTEPRDFVPVLYEPEVPSSPILTAGARLAVLGIVATMVRIVAKRQGGGFGSGGFGDAMYQVGWSNSKKFSSKDINISFRDVAGCGVAKREIMEFVDFLKDSSRFSKLGAKIPKGALLTGPPGTGKTLLAKAVAGEAGVPFYSASGSDFVEMFAGVGPSRVRDLFREARDNAPCIIFIDEIDAIGRKRSEGGGYSSGGGEERENTLNQLLVEMDGFQSSSGVVVLAGTNRVDILDDALTRPGRFDRRILVDKPDLQGRKEIFLVHLKGITLDGKAEDIACRLAGLTPGFSGADISNLCNEAAIVAARQKADAVCMSDFEKATERVIGGLESTKIMGEREKRIVAHHEAGHAVAAWFLEHADLPLKISIIPRCSGSLGYAQYLPNDIFLRTHDQIMDTVCVALAGRAAEDFFFNEVTTGAADDLKRVTGTVYDMIQAYGMNSCLGHLTYAPSSKQGNKPYSDATASIMDREARQIVDDAYQRTLGLISKKKSHVEAVACLLLERETLQLKDIHDILGDRAHSTNAVYDEYVLSGRHEGVSKDGGDCQGYSPRDDVEDPIPDLAFSRN